MWDTLIYTGTVMSFINYTKNSLSDIKNKAKDKWRGFKDWTNAKTLALGTKSSEKYGYVDEELTQKYLSLRNRYRVRKYNTKNKLKRKWRHKWSNYANYALWSFAPFVIAYGVLTNFVLDQMGLYSLSIGHSIASGVGAYAIKYEFPEWMNSIEWVHKDESSEV